MPLESEKFVYGVRPLPTRREKLGVTTPNQWKRAALIFDRIWIPSSIDIDHGKIGQGGRTYIMQPHRAEIPPELTFGGTNLDHDITSASSVVAYRRRDGALEVTGDENEQYRIYDVALRIVAVSYTIHGVPVTPLYPSERLMRSQIFDGPAIAYQAALEHIPLIDDSSVTWPEIIEFRKDKDAARKVRRLGLWLVDGLKCDSVAHASDVIAARIEDYKWALQKHGLKTVTGAASYIAAGGGATAVLNALSQPIWESIAVGLTFTAATCAWVAERLIDHEDAVRGANSEVAILYDAQRKFKRPITE